jgi:hypothetical protein
MRTHPAHSRSFIRASALGTAALAIAVAGCSSAPDDEAASVDSTSGDAPVAAGSDVLTAAEQAEGWRPLFDGDDLEQWRGYQRDTPPASWQPQDSVLAFVAGEERGDLMTREQFGDFEFRFDWKISEGGNSGVIYRVTESSERPWHTGPEMQILDDERHPDAKAGVGGNRTAGSLYDMIAPGSAAVRPAGEWNEAGIVARGGHVEHWLNGQKVVEYEVGSDEWNRLYEASKFSELEGFGVQERGHIVLQDHNDAVWFRNLRIRSLEP